MLIEYPNNLTAQAAVKKKDMSGICLKEIQVNGVKRAGLVGDHMMGSDADAEFLFTRSDIDAVDVYNNAVDKVSVDDSLQRLYDLNFYCELLQKGKTITPLDTSCLDIPELENKDFEYATYVLDAKLRRHGHVVPPSSWPISHTPTESTKIDELCTLYITFREIHMEGNAKARKTIERQLMDTMCGNFKTCLKKETLTIHDLVTFHFLKVEGYALANTLGHFRTFASSLGGLGGIIKKHNAQTPEQRTAVVVHQYEEEFKTQLMNEIQKLYMSDSPGGLIIQQMAALEHIVDSIVHFDNTCVMKKGKYLHRLVMCACSFLMMKTCNKEAVLESLKTKFSDHMRKSLEMSISIKEGTEGYDNVKGAQLGIDILKDCVTLASGRSGSTEHESLELDSTDFLVVAKAAYKLFKGKFEPDKCHRLRQNAMDSDFHNSNP